MKQPQREDNDRTQRDRQMECSQRKTDEPFWNVFKHSLTFYHMSPDWTPPFSAVFYSFWFFSVWWPFSWYMLGFLFKFMTFNFLFDALSSIFVFFTYFKLWCHSHVVFRRLHFYDFLLFLLPLLVCENEKCISIFQCRPCLLLSDIYYMSPTARPHHTLHLHLISFFLKEFVKLKKSVLCWW